MRTFLAGDAAEGIVGHVGLTADAPQPTVKAFDAKYQAEYKQRSDHNGMKGYSAVYIVKAVTEKISKFDSKALAAALHGARSRRRTTQASFSSLVRPEGRPRSGELHGQGREWKAAGDRDRAAGREQVAAHNRRVAESLGE